MIAAAALFAIAVGAAIAGLREFRTWAAGGAAPPIPAPPPAGGPIVRVVSADRPFDWARDDV